MFAFCAIVFGFAAIFAKRQGVRLVYMLLILFAITAGIGYASNSFTIEVKEKEVIEIPTFEEVTVIRKEDYISFYSASFKFEHVDPDLVDFQLVDDKEPTRVVVQEKTCFYKPEQILLIDFGLFTRITKTKEVYTIYIQKRHAQSIFPPTGPTEDDVARFMPKDDITTC